ncbi:hypothetical protein XELAEV_18044497mg [Xenopus laevis]|uniref:Uncharacterized protein n=1 Tax=Xenopus laevis TaxID=8355 RepID=A0A974BZ13_XENLA|nr:hypothetical protein XELAEV_18044497mg [Xenopus laevis]
MLDSSAIRKGQGVNKSCKTPGFSERLHRLYKAVIAPKAPTHPKEEGKKVNDGGGASLPPMAESSRQNTSISFGKTEPTQER